MARDIFIRFFSLPEMEPTEIAAAIIRPQARYCHNGGITIS
ncbi:hypothetical protein PT7_0868 [Pusillimonas sp. T7-7]|nr:hypothetical protein PT7_0868 [Pusillimonas sp. T7-7]